MRIKEIEDGTYSAKVYYLSFEPDGTVSYVKNNDTKENFITRRHFENLILGGNKEKWEGFDNEIDLVASVDFEFYHIFMPHLDKKLQTYTRFWSCEEAYQKNVTQKTHIAGENLYYFDFSGAYPFCWEEIRKMGIPILESTRSYEYVTSTGLKIKRTYNTTPSDFKLGEMPIYFDPIYRNSKRKAECFKVGARDAFPEEIYNKLSKQFIKSFSNTAIGMLKCGAPSKRSVSKPTENRKVVTYLIKDGKLVDTECSYKEVETEKKRIDFLKTKHLVSKCIIERQRQKMEDIDTKGSIVCANTDGGILVFDGDVEKLVEDYPNLKIHKIRECWVNNLNNFAFLNDLKEFCYWGDLYYLVKAFPEVAEYHTGKHKLKGVEQELLVEQRELKTAKVDEKNKDEEETWKKLCRELVDSLQIITNLDFSVAGSGKTTRLLDYMTTVGAEKCYVYTYNISNQKMLRDKNEKIQVTGLLKNIFDAKTLFPKERLPYALLDEGQDCSYRQLFYILQNIEKGGVLQTYLDTNQDINWQSNRGDGIGVDFFQNVKYSLTSHRISAELAEFIRDIYGIEIYGTYNEYFEFGIKTFDEVEVKEGQTFIPFHNLTGHIKTTGETTSRKVRYENTIYKVKGLTMDNAIAFIDYPKVKTDYVGITRLRHNGSVFYTPNAWQKVTEQIDLAIVAKWEKYAFDKTVVDAKPVVEKEEKNVKYNTYLCKDDENFVFEELCIIPPVRDWWDIIDEHMEILRRLQ